MTSGMDHLMHIFGHLFPRIFSMRIASTSNYHSRPPNEDPCLVRGRNHHHHQDDNDEEEEEEGEEGV